MSRYRCRRMPRYLQRRRARAQRPRCCQGRRCLPWQQKPQSPASTVRAEISSRWSPMTLVRPIGSHWPAASAKSSRRRPRRPSRSVTQQTKPCCRCRRLPGHPHGRRRRCRREESPQPPSSKKGRQGLEPPRRFHWPGDRATGARAEALSRRRPPPAGVAGSQAPRAMSAALPVLRSCGTAASRPPAAQHGGRPAVWGSRPAPVGLGRPGRTRPAHPCRAAHAQPPLRPHWLRRCSATACRAGVAAGAPPAGIPRPRRCRPPQEAPAEEAVAASSTSSGAPPLARDVAASAPVRGLQRGR
mmetsp:Transcript_69521/g.201811  ORF Transcript_69521/g.201811 Transcript_69521/m.201811 type:complete len:300 (-) Transcript_69521:442-1341(-)